MIRIGTCSWKYESWKGIIYPEKERFNFLEEYSKHFNCVEVDQWFWSLFEERKVVLPKPSDVKSYSDSVPDDFRFSIKVPNSITLTHFYNKNKSAELKSNPFFLSNDLFSQFIESLKPLEKNIGILMFQFEYLNKQKLSGLTEFVDRFEGFCDKLDKVFSYGIEIRNPNYLKKPFFDFLDRNKISIVFLQGYYMPPVWQVFKDYKDTLVSPVVIRLHGPDRTGMENKTGRVWNKIVEPKDEELEKVAEITNYLSSQKADVYINVNNHFEGCAPLTINKLKKLIVKF